MLANTIYTDFAVLERKVAESMLKKKEIDSPVKLVFSLSGDDALTVAVWTNDVEFSIADSSEPDRTILISKENAIKIREHLERIK